MLINGYSPSFSSKYKINIKDKPDEIFYVVNLSINPNVKIKPAKPEGDIQHGGLNYIAEVPDRLDNSFLENLEANKIRFNKIA